MWVFVDESGHIGHKTSLSSAFSGAVWCVPKPGMGLPKVLRPTILEVKDTLASAYGGRREAEVKYSHGAGKHARSVLEAAICRADYDETVYGNHGFWHPSSIVFSFSRLDINAERCFSGASRVFNGDDTPDFWNMIRARIVGDVLQPLMFFDGEENVHVTIVLDGTNWRPGIEYYYGNRLQKLKMPGKISCEVVYCNSKDTPGLQIADVVAGVTRAFSTDCDNVDAFDFIARHSIHRIGKRGVKFVAPLLIEKNKK